MAKKMKKISRNVSVIYSVIFFENIWLFTRAYWDVSGPIIPGITGIVVRGLQLATERPRDNVFRERVRPLTPSLRLVFLHIYGKRLTDVPTYALRFDIISNDPPDAAQRTILYNFTLKPSPSMISFYQLLWKSSVVLNNTYVMWRCRLEHSSSVIIKPLSLNKESSNERSSKS
ncbi:hypothetical protein CBL_03590 [Carabus blaptoides fortunei]